MGQPKLLLPWVEGPTVIDATLKAWRTSRVDEVVVVVRADDVLLAEQCRSHGVYVLPLPDAPPHMKDSVTAALRWIQEHFTPTTSDVWLLAPADMPRLSAPTVDQLLDEHDAAAPVILKPSYRGRHGHPVLFPWSCAQAAMNLPPDQGIDSLTRSSPVRTIPCEDPGLLDDLDTPQDYDSLRASQHPKIK